MRKKLLICSLIILFSIIAPLNHEAHASTTTDDLVEFALKYQGTPYLFGGTTPQSGFDCSGYLRYVFNHFNIDIPRTSAQQFNIGEQITRANLKKGDLVFFRNTYKIGISHSGIYVGNNRFISAKSSGVRIESLDHSYWGPKYAGARRIIEEPKEPVVVLEELPLGRYHDIPERHWAYKAVFELSNSAIVNGFGQSMFRPNEQITRAQAAVIINRELKLEVSSPATFPDVSGNSTVMNSISALQEAGIMTGFSNGLFGPNNPVTRGQMAVILQRAYDLKQDEVNIASIEPSFTDVAPGYFAYEAIELLKQNGITAGFPDQTFRPEQNTTRAEFTVFLHRILNN